MSFLSNPRDWTKSLTHAKQGLYQMEKLRRFLFLISLSQGLTISFRWGLNSCWSPGRSPACDCPASASKEAGNPGLPHQAWLTVFLILWAIWFPKNKSTWGWSDWTGLTWNTEVGLWNPRESYKQGDGAAGCRAGTEGNICRGASSITVLSTRSFLCKDEVWRAQKDDYGILYRLPSSLWAKHKKVAEGSPLPALRKSFSPFSGDSVLVAPKDVCPSSSVPYTCCSQDHPGPGCVHPAAHADQVQWHF